jgi:hypothetical protein
MPKKSPLIGWDWALLSAGLGCSIHRVGMHAYVNVTEAHHRRGDGMLACHKNRGFVATWLRG